MMMNSKMLRALIMLHKECRNRHCMDCELSSVSGPDGKSFCERYFDGNYPDMWDSEAMEKLVDKLDELNSAPKVGEIWWNKANNILVEVLGVDGDYIHFNVVGDIGIEFYLFDEFMSSFEKCNGVCDEQRETQNNSSKC